MVTKKEKETMQERILRENKEKRQKALSTPDRLELATSRARNAGIPDPYLDPKTKEIRVGTFREEEAQRQETLRRAQFGEETGSEALRLQLEQNIANPPSLAPDPLTGKPAGDLAEVGLTKGTFLPVEKLQNALAQGSVGKLIGAKKLTTEQIAQTKVGKALGIGILGADVAVGAFLTIPTITRFVASSTIGGAVAGKGGSIPLLKTAVAGLGIVAFGRGVFDFEGGEMDILRQGIKKVVEDGERIEASVRNGYSPADSIGVLTQMSEELESAESRIKELGNNNLRYRVDKQFILDQQNARSAREAILRRVIAIENIAATGQAALSPEELLIDLARFE